MTEALLKLAAWLSPGYPIGAFAYSQGLEQAVAAGDVSDATALAGWLADVIGHGAGRTDAILLAHAWRATAAGDGAAFAELSALASALAPSAERLLETEAQGAAFAATTAAAWGGEGSAAPYPVVVGRAAAEHDVPLGETLALYLQAFAANIVSAGIRLIPLGQTEGQGVLAELSPLIRAVAAEAGTAPLDAIGGAAFLADIAAMRHETLGTRLFRS